MRILNLMLGRGRGGLEQAALDYHEALNLHGHHVLSVLHPRASICDAASLLPGDTKPLAQLGEWDVLAARRLRRIGRQAASDLVIAHGNRAIGLGLAAFSGRIPVIGVAHNYHLRRFARCDAVFAVTRDLMEEMVHLDIPRSCLFHIPNMTRVAPVSPRTAFARPPVIGALGRFVAKKGFDILLQAIRTLQEQGVAVEAVIGGDGPLLPALRAQAAGLPVRFPGWIDDKQAFFRSLDLFVLPSHHEPFGIALIEAMAAGLPCITTDTEGPCEIIRHEQDAVMIEKDRPFQMARAIADLLESPERAFAIGYAAHLKARDRYDITAVAPLLHQAAARVLQLAQRATAAV